MLKMGEVAGYRGSQLEGSEVQGAPLLYVVLNSTAFDRGRTMLWPLPASLLVYLA